MQCALADIAYTSGTIWFSYNSATQSGIGSIASATSVVTLNATNDPINTWYAAPILAASANGELAAGEPDQSPVQLATYNLSSGTATVLAPKYLDQNADNLQSMQITGSGGTEAPGGWPWPARSWRSSSEAAWFGRPRRARSATRVTGCPCRS
jgi:hypothetical protein